jgi:hypothetical protein
MKSEEFWQFEAHITDNHVPQRNVCTSNQPVEQQYLIEGSILPMYAEKTLRMGKSDAAIQINLGWRFAGIFFISGNIKASKTPDC